MHVVFMDTVTCQWLRHLKATLFPLEYNRGLFKQKKLNHLYSTTTTAIKSITEHVCLNSKVKQGPWSLPLENSRQEDWSFTAVLLMVFLVHIRLCNQFTCENFKGKVQKCANENIPSERETSSYQNASLWIIKEEKCGFLWDTALSLCGSG